jgi:RNA polymerase sigma-70 factor (ECF subfamily)
MKTASPEATVSSEGEKPVNLPGKSASKPKTDTAPATSDRDLVGRVQTGDEVAFRELFDRYHRRAFAVALGVVKNKQDALDIVQDAFIKVHRHIGNFQGSSSFYTWLYRIVMNLSIDHVRRTKKHRNLDYDDRVGRDAGDVAGDGALLPKILDGNPSKTVLRRELTEAIQKALDELPEYHRAVIMLREVEGLSYEEMSSVLKVPKGTIMSRHFHARRKMQGALSDYVGGELRIED